MKKKEQFVKDVIFNGGLDNLKFDFKINSWGSCQYSSALATYNYYFKVRESLSLEDTLKTLEIDFPYNKINKFKDVKKLIRKDIIEMYSDSDYYDKEDLNKRIHRLESVNSFDDLMRFYRKSAHDLWGASRDVFEYVFEGIELKNVPKSEGFGPDYNQSMQEINIKTGLQCALLKEFGAIKKEESFMGFDT